ncbi:Uncharacterised protein [Mycobacterium tuberculosis]|nr:Uncharacterised protein [Mycobacterium tuberculosis]
MSDWLRRERLTNIALMLPRRTASSAASRTASRWTSSKARATWPISSVESISIGSTSIPPAAASGSRSRSTRPGSRVLATSSAPDCSRRSGRTSERATTMTVASTIAMTRNSRIPSRMAAVCASDSASCALTARSAAMLCSTARSLSTRAPESDVQACATFTPSLAFSCGDWSAMARARSRVNSARSSSGPVTVSSNNRSWAAVAELRNAAMLVFMSARASSTESRSSGSNRPCHSAEEISARSRDAASLAWARLARASAVCASSGVGASCETSRWKLVKSSMNSLYLSMIGPGASRADSWRSDVSSVTRFTTLPRTSFIAGESALTSAAASRTFRAAESADSWRDFSASGLTAREPPAALSAIASRSFSTSCARAVN